MSVFDKLCALLAIPIGILFMILGVIGFFAGSNANFNLPPILGGLPFFLGWGMSVPLIKYWRDSGRRREENGRHDEEMRRYHEDRRRYHEENGRYHDEHEEY